MENGTNQAGVFSPTDLVLPQYRHTTHSNNVELIIPDLFIGLYSITITHFEAQVVPDLAMEASSNCLLCPSDLFPIILWPFCYFLAQWVAPDLCNLSLSQPWQESFLQRASVPFSGGEGVFGSCKRNQLLLRPAALWPPTSYSFPNGCWKLLHFFLLKWKKEAVTFFFFFKKGR